MWPAFKKLIIAFILPIIGFFSFSRNETPTQSAIGVRAPSEISEAIRPQPTMPQKSLPGGDEENREVSAILSPEIIKDCQLRGSQSGTCLDWVFRKFLSMHSTSEALAAVERLGEADSRLRLSCHPIIHAIGRETFRLKKTIHDSFTACNQTCHSGCYHGAMERFLRGDTGDEETQEHITLAELTAKAATACDPNQPTRFRFQCLHGLGHAVVFFTDYHLIDALAVCDVLADAWSRSSCYGGAFMENVFSATPEKRDLSPTDYHYPCRALDVKYRLDCYMMQTTRMTEMGLTTERLFDECRKAGAYAFVCMQSIGRDLSNDVRIGDPALVAKKCELGIGSERQACTRGVAYALIDNTWDGRYALPLCASFRGADDAAYCLTITDRYLAGTFEKSKDDRQKECAAYVPHWSTCPAGVSP